MARQANRRFGRALCGFCIGLTVVPWVFGGTPNYPFLIPAALALVTALIRPNLLGPMRHGLKWAAAHVQRVTSPIFLTAIFFLVFTPGAFCLRTLARADFLKLKPDPAADSYWIERTAKNHPSGGMKDQF